MTGIVDWAASRARMVLAFILLSLAIGVFAYTQLPKEGEPDIEIPALFISVPFPGISAADSETLLVKPMETELADLDGLDTMQGTAAEGYAGMVLEFEFGWDKTAVMADVRDAMQKAEAEFPEGAETYTINEFNFSEFPIIIVSLSGPVPERTMNRIAKDLQDKIESNDAVLEASLAGNRDEMVEVIIDPLRLEAYNVTAAELIQVVQNNNQLIAAGEVDTDQGSFAVKIPSSFDTTEDVYNLPVKTNGDRVITLGDLAQINLTFEDREGTARFDGEKTVALQVVKRKGYNLIDTANLVRELVAAESQDWPEGLQAAVEVESSNDQSRQVNAMVSQLEGSVLTAIALVMIVSLAVLGLRASLLVGFAIPTSFLLCFAFLALMGVSISNIVMFGLILAVGMLVDGAIVVVEYADKKQAEGIGPMESYVMSAKRMFWPVVSSTATTLCAFLPMLFWPGVPGEFMGMLPVTLIFVLSASLLVALIYLPVMGGVVGMLENLITTALTRIARLRWFLHIGLIVLAIGSIAAAGAVFAAMMSAQTANFAGFDGNDVFGSVVPIMAIAVLIGFVMVGSVGFITAGAISAFLWVFAALPRIGLRVPFRGARARARRYARVKSGYTRSIFGWLITAIVSNPIMPLAVFGGVVVLVSAVLFTYINNNKGVEFFVESETEQAIVYVLARGNLSLDEKDEIVREAEEIVNRHPGIMSAFAFAGEGGLTSNDGGAGSPKDTIGQIQIETIPWEDRAGIEELDGDVVVAELQEELSQIPGVRIEILSLSRGPASGKPVHLRLKGDSLDELIDSVALARAEFERTPGMVLIEDTRPLPGIDWQIDVDVEKAGRYGADVATVGGMVQLVTRGILLDTMRVPSSDEEIDIRVRLPESDRVLSTLDTLKVRTRDGLVPLANFTTRTPVPSLAEISRVDQTRYLDLKADVALGYQKLVDADDTLVATLRAAESDATVTLADGTGLVPLPGSPSAQTLQDGLDAGDLRAVPINPNERIALFDEWLATNPLPDGITTEWTGDQEEQAESGAFLSNAFAAALGLMFIILLAQFNSFYNSVLVLLAVILSTTGVLIGMMVMDQAFSIIMTGTGIVALAGIVVNNNIVLIDTYQDYARFMPRIEAIIRTAQDRIRPVMLTTVTTMAGLAPMMFGLSIDFASGGYSVDSPTALWWKQLATAVVWGLGIATVLTLVFTPSMLAARVWATTYALWTAQLLAKLSMGRASKAARDWALDRDAKRMKQGELIWDVETDTPEPAPKADTGAPLRAAE